VEATAVIASGVREAVVALGRPERGDTVAAYATPRRNAVVVRQVVVWPVAVPVHRPEGGVRPVPVRHIVVRPVAVAGVEPSWPVRLCRTGGCKPEPGDPKDSG